MSKYKTDFHTMKDGYYVRLMPNNEQAQGVYAQIDENFKGGVIPRGAWAQVRAQIVAAGYTLRKAPKVNISSEDLLKQIEGA